MINEEVGSAEKLAERLEIKIQTAWTYVCQLLNKEPNVDIALSLLTWIDDRCLNICKTMNPSGSLSEAVSLMDSLIQDDDWFNNEYRYSHVRLCRLCLDIIT